MAVVLAQLFDTKQQLLLEQQQEQRRGSGAEASGSRGSSSTSGQEESSMSVLGGDLSGSGSLFDSGELSPSRD